MSRRVVLGYTLWNGQRRRCRRHRRGILAIRSAATRPSQRGDRGMGGLGTHPPTAPRSPRKPLKPGNWGHRTQQRTQPPPHSQTPQDPALQEPASAPISVYEARWRRPRSAAARGRARRDWARGARNARRSLVSSGDPSSQRSQQRTHDTRGNPSQQLQSTVRCAAHERPPSSFGLAIITARGTGGPGREAGPQARNQPVP